MTGSQVVRFLCFVSLLLGVSPGGSATPLYSFTTIDVSTANFTPNFIQTFRINDAGEVVGLFDININGEVHGFFATPVPDVPEPATWLLLGSGLVGLVWWRKR